MSLGKLATVVVLTKKPPLLSVSVSGGSMSLIMSLMVLHDKFGFGEKRLKKFHTEIANLGECLIAGTVNLDEIKEYLQENCKVKF